MTNDQDKDFQVLIVGAGPTGLMMACQLALHHISFCLIDKRTELFKSSGALIVQSRSLEIFGQMGIAQQAIAEGIIAHKLNIYLNGKKNIGINIKDIGQNCSQFPFLLMLEQSITEKLLLKFLSEHGHSVERGITFQSFNQDDEGIKAILTLPDKTLKTLKTNYLIAADGANSTIRNFLNISFVGKTYPKPICILDAKANTNFEPNEINFFFSRLGTSAFFPLKNTRWRIDNTLSNETEKLKNITAQQIEVDINHNTRMPITILANDWFSVSYAHQKYASLVNIHRCFLTGDAAHLNTPIGAQGMNTGMQDAFNLAWKLAFVIQGKTKPILLNSYQIERAGISGKFAKYADKIFNLITSKKTAVIFFRFCFLYLLMIIFYPLVGKTKRLRTHFFKSISQINIQYRKSPLSFKNSDDSFFGKNPKPGDRMPYVEFIFEGKVTSNYKILNPICFNIFIFAKTIPEEIETISAKYGITILFIKQMQETKNMYVKFGITNTGFFLIRPDMHIALRSNTLNTFHLNHYLERHLSA